MTTTKKTRKKNTSTPAAEPSIADRIKPVGEIPVYIKALIYGRSGTGKTHFIGTCPKPLLVLDVRDEGTTTIRAQEDTDVLEVESWDDIEAIYWYLESAGKGKYKTVAIDTMTQLQEMAIEKVRGTSEGNISQRQWGEAASLLKTWILLYRDLDMNVIFTAQDRLHGGSDDIDDAGALDPEVGPYLMPSVAKILNAAVSVIGHTFIREEVKKVKVRGKPQSRSVISYCMRLGPHAYYTTKLRRDPSASAQAQIPDFITNPTFDQILELTLGGKN